MNEYIDLNIVDRKFKNGEYYGTFSFVQDIRNIWTKAFKFMKDDPEVIKRARELSSLFE